MTVAELIAELQKMPQNIIVSVNDERGANWHETVSGVFLLPSDPHFDNVEHAVIVVNPE